MKLNRNKLLPLLIPLATALGLQLAAAPAQALSVTDFTHIALQKAAWAKQVADMARQLTEVKAQLTQLRQTYEAVNRITKVGDLVNNPQLNNVLPPDIAAALKSGKVTGAQALAAINKVYGAENTTLQSAVAQRFTATANQNAAFEAANAQSLAAAQERVAAIDALRVSIGATPDNAQKTDLANRIAAEAAFIANANVQAQLMAGARANADAVARQQAREMNLAMTAPGGVPRFGYTGQ